ncbi:MAG: MBL fold metallo-hydrolase [Bryobacteraceae bacterium]
MRFRRILTASAFVALLGAGLYRTTVQAQPGSLKQIVPGVWFREGDLKELGHCNNVIIEMKDYLIVVDANFPSGARLALADAKKVSPKPVKYVFDTHHHGDHLYGNPVWTQAGATTLAYVGVAEELKRYEPKSWLAAAKERKDVADLHLPTAEPPKQTFKETPFVLTDGNRRVEFHFFGWAHTRGDGFVYLPKEKLICTGDAIVNGPYNYTAQGNMGNWPNVVDKVQKLDFKYVLPGHGGPGGREIPEGQKAFFVELKKAVAARMKAGAKLDDLAPKGADGKRMAKLDLPAAVKNWVGDSFATQVQDQFEEIAQGKPHGEIVGGK